jgi:HrpA-like RNA helicase
LNYFLFTFLKVGLRIGMEPRKGPAYAQIVFATAGYVFHKFVHAPEELTSYTHIIIDEVHERSVDNDVICLLANELYRQPGSVLSVILMSATMDSRLFYEYFCVKPLREVPPPVNSLSSAFFAQQKDVLEKEINQVHEDEIDETIALYGTVLNRIIVIYIF